SVREGRLSQSQKAPIGFVSHNSVSSFPAGALHSRDDERRTNPCPNDASKVPRFLNGRIAAHGRGDGIRTQVARHHDPSHVTSDEAPRLVGDQGSITVPVRRNNGIKGVLCRPTCGKRYVFISNGFSINRNEG